jgi:hypothetical protein
MTLRSPHGGRGGGRSHLECSLPVCSWQPRQLHVAGDPDLSASASTSTLLPLTRPEQRQQPRQHHVDVGRCHSRSRSRRWWSCRRDGRAGA